MTTSRHPSPEEELRALHERREREPLDDVDEARYAALWAWWQAGGDPEAAPLAEASPPASPDEFAPGPLLPEEPAAAPEPFLLQPDTDPDPEVEPAPQPEPFLLQPDADDPAPKPEGAEPDLAAEWAAWQASRGAEPLQEPAESAAPESYEAMLAARADVFGAELPPPDAGDAPRDEGPPPAEASALESFALGVDEPAPPLPVVPGTHRVVVHTVEGLVRRGTVTDLDLGAATLPYRSLPAGADESVPMDGVKAIFFLRDPGAPPAPATGKHLRVTFRDGREVTGTSPDHHDLATGFFVVPADPRTNTARIWVFREVLRGVAVL